MNTPQAFSAIVFRSDQMKAVLSLCQRVARSPIPTVLVVGPTGTGKELVARAIHGAGSNVSDPFVAINCAAIPSALLESELFGHVPGAFTDARTEKIGLFELASSGTVLLDEVVELSLELQAKLLRVLENRVVRRVGGVDERPVMCRVIAAANRPLEDAVARGEFREDLYYRLNVFRIDVPALRDRPGDIDALVQHFLVLGAKQHGLERPKRVSDDAFAVLRAHTWPGNVRELRNVIERAMVLCDGDVIEPEHVVIQRRVAIAGSAGAIAGEIAIPQTGMKLEDIEREAIRITLELTRGNRTAAAEMLGISRPTLHRRLAEERN
ncbi:MAG TPA: sigma-54 dependent transcriptional regulator [Longimicrobiales bacterium]